MSDRMRLSRWTSAEVDVFEWARALLNVVIAACSGRIGDASIRGAARAFRAERALLLEARDRMAADDQDRIAVILREVPDQLTAVREGGSGG
ncbi:hypothetical protein P8A18_34180 (plasmid) [Streptomyces castrisilvae]|uniref:Uncharacterized protein n=1 Tax=Streptomyces castrisilvae TaxID=3033811 RepID=A0ABY9HVL4_9ACTN|nr:hypothetical protein [Streptomyces sp. Mut1]WLQ37980.1 hypothetical protein P8A18_33070 [Streptomyces sp. Mut1]WLQ38565.1 hypothetical protein P8A18_34180 [Streptomyces sp. Mut1]